MTSLDNTLKQMLEHLFAMRSGYVLDFTNASFADFVDTSVGFDPYSRYQGSKAAILRAIWQQESTPVVRKLTLEMLERWNTNALLSCNKPSEHDLSIYHRAKKAADALGGEAEAPDLTFLERDFSDLDLTALRRELSSAQVIAQRLDEIERCMEAEAPLAVVFLCGSTLEGLLLEVARAHPENFTTSKSAPKRHGKVKPLEEWTLAELVVTSRELQVIGEDVVKHADAVRNFRNYIHPRQQQQELFSPRMFTAKMARYVLLTALADLGAASEKS